MLAERQWAGGQCYAAMGRWPMLRSNGQMANAKRHGQVPNARQQDISLKSAGQRALLATKNTYNG